MRHVLFFCLLIVFSYAADVEAAKGAPIDIAVMRPKAETGDAKAQLEMGKAYYFGRGVKKDVQEATKWYRMAYEQGDLDGQCAYAGLLLRSGVKKNVRLALELYQKAAAQGFPRALFELGIVYYHGAGVEQDPFVGAEWFEKAALAGYVLGQYNIGLLLVDENSPSKQNEVDGLAWFTIASEAGDKQAMVARDALLKKVKPGTVSAAQSRVMQFKAEIERVKRLREHPVK